jgi:chemotaxis protein CheD
MSAERVNVRLGDLQVLVGAGTLYTIGLGSCVAVILYDAETRVGGLAHVMLPDDASGQDARLGRFAPTAVPRLLELMVSADARAGAVFARIVGGAAMFAEALPRTACLGERNVTAVKAALEKAGIPLRGEDVGGASGRSVFFDTQDGSLIVRVVQRADVAL